MPENNVKVYSRRIKVYDLTLLKRKWKESWSDKYFRSGFLSVLFYFAGLAIFFPWFFDFIEARNSKILDDAFLNLLPAHNVSWIIFLCLYSGMMLSLIYLVKHPRLLLVSLMTYCMATTLRIASITLFPLNPPERYIPLHEPVAQLFMHGGRIISKDLFFSGHVVTILSLYFPLENKKLRVTLLFLAFAIGLLVLVQHAHYTIDVVMAVLATYGCFLFAQRITSKIKSEN